MNNIKNCTRCGNLLTDSKFFVSLDISAFQEKESKTWENIPPLCIKTNEVLCEKCFNGFIDSIIMESNNVSKR